MRRTGGGSQTLAMVAASRARSVATPRTIRAADLLLLVVANGLLIVGMWVRHGGLQELATTAGRFTAEGQLTALLGTYLVLIQLILMARSPWLEQRFGMDGLARAHKWVGFSVVWLLLGHGALTTIGYAMGDRQSILGEAWTLLTTYPYVLMATAGMALFVAVAVSSVRAVRGRVSYETWYGIHLYAYLAVALTFAHQLAVGTDFSSDPLARIYWIALYAATALLILTFRVGHPIAVNLRHRLRVAQVVQESPDTLSVYVTGRELERLPVRAGQYFTWRFLARDGWWRAHPYSLSAAPNGQYLRLTVKALGDGSSAVWDLTPGTRVIVEGPYGVLTGARRIRQRSLLIAGGIGITPLRALLEELPAPPNGLTLLYRASSWDDVVFGAELDELMAERGAAVHYLVGRRGSAEVPDDPLGPAMLLALVPDVRRRDVFLCGPVPMMEAAIASLAALGVPSAQVHAERFAY
jgi:predicted ferric reductase